MLRESIWDDHQVNALMADPSIAEVVFEAVLQALHTDDLREVAKD